MKNTKIKVLQVNKLYYPHIGGVEKHVQDVAEALADRVDFRILVANNHFKTVNETINGIEVTKIASLGSISSAPVAPTFGCWLRRARPDIFHFHFPYPLGEFSFLFTKTNAKLVVTYHSDIIRQKKLLALYRPFMMRFLKKADKILVSSPNLIANSPVLRHFREKCQVIPFGIDTNRFALTPDVERKAAGFRKQFNHKNIILFTGRLAYYKGLSYLVEAMKEIDGALVLAGEGNLRGQLESQARSAGVLNKIVFLGKIAEQDLPPLYYACDVFVLPSIAQSEAFGLVQLEAQACGKPVISTDLPTGVPYANLDGETGLIVPPKNGPALSEAINKLLNDQELRKRLGEAGKKRVNSQFSLEAMAQAVLKVYESCLS